MFCDNRIRLETIKNELFLQTSTILIKLVQELCVVSYIKIILYQSSLKESKWFYIDLNRKKWM